MVYDAIQIGSDVFVCGYNPSQVRDYFGSVYYSVQYVSTIKSACGCCRTVKILATLRRTMALHVRYNSWYISLPFSTKQQREMTKFCVVWRT